MKILRLTLPIILTLGIVFTAFGQSESDSLSKRKLRKQRIKARPHYVVIGAGSSFVSLRDFATSPLFYRGIANVYSSGFVRKDEKREAQFGVDYTFVGGGLFGLSGLTATVDDEVVGDSKLRNINFFYTQLYQVKKFSNEKWNVKAGGSLMTNWGWRINEDLRNNAVGFENISTLFASAKATKDISRRAEVQKKFLFIKYKLKPKTRFLSYQFNLALVNSTFRNGFIYRDQSGLLNNDDIFGGYEFKVFSGYRLNAALAYGTYLKNGNIISWAYQWDAFRTGGDFDRLELAQHSLRLNFFFKTN